MNSVCKTLIVLGALIAVAHSLTCRRCFIGVFGSCFFPDEVSCTNGTHRCYSGDAQFNATGALRLHTRGCLDSDLCGVTLTGTILTAAYTSSFTCCNTDLCNSAPSLSVAVGTVLTLLATFWVSQ